MEQPKRLVVMDADDWRSFTWALIMRALNRPNATVDQIREEVAPVLDAESKVRYDWAAS